MKYWLVKSEPFKYPFEQLIRDKKTGWDGVRNYAARNNLKAMAKGDLVLFYHSNEGKEIVGLAKVVKTFYQDPTTDDSNWVSVDLSPVKAFNKPLSLGMIKSHTILSKMEMIRLSRLSVTSVSTLEFEEILKLTE